MQVVTVHHARHVEEARLSVERTIREGIQMNRTALKTVRCVLLLVVVLAVTSGCRPKLIVERINIIEYGTYSADLLGTKKGAEGINIDTVTHVRNLVTTHEVPVQIGTRFGFRFRVVGAPNEAVVRLKKITLFPGDGLRISSTSRPIHNYENVITVRLDQISYTGYMFSEPWELVPGTWTIELWYGDRKLSSQSFTARSP